MYSLFKGGRLLGVSVFVLPDELETAAIAAGTKDKEHAVVVKPSQSKPVFCEDQDSLAHGVVSDKTTARPGEWVIWENTMPKDIALDFTIRTPFEDVKTIVVKAGTKLGYRVSENAAGVEPIGYNYTVTVKDRSAGGKVPPPLAGPVIIVPPPPPGPGRGEPFRPRIKRTRPKIKRTRPARRRPR